MRAEKTPGRSAGQQKLRAKQLEKEQQKEQTFPVRVILWTTDNIATMLAVTEQTLLRGDYLHFEGRSMGAPPRWKMLARNISPHAWDGNLNICSCRDPNCKGEKPQWRVAELELYRWLQYKGFKIYREGTLSH